ncbi:MAG: DEAD/DEAH box helicase, partial [Ardenticatenia bacterium]|nr:DEAD/DEAH box helicase [Ardenticatenia bacterium]
PNTGLRLVRMRCCKHGQRFSYAMQKQRWGTFAAEPDRVRLLVHGEALTRLVVAWRRLHVAWRVLTLLAHTPTEVPVTQITRHTGATWAHLEQLARAGLVRVDEREVYRMPLAGHTWAPDTPPELTPEQQKAWAELQNAVRQQQGHVILLHGVTGSGKTELYLRAVAETLALGKQAIVLVPEIALTPQTVARFGARFGDRVAVLHSRLSAGARFDEWRRLRDGHASVAIGSRSALFAPVPDPGLIVIDEEHEWTYKQEGVPGLRLPHYHARDVAIHLAQLTGAAVILGSATPSLEAYERAQQGGYRLVRLRERVITSPSPRAHFRLLTHLPSAGHPVGPGGTPGRRAPSRSRRGPAGRAQSRQHEHLQPGAPGGRGTGASSGRAVPGLLFINRRGSHTFVMCRDQAGCPSLCLRWWAAARSYPQQVVVG